MEDYECCDFEDDFSINLEDEYNEDYVATSGEELLARSYETNIEFLVAQHAEDLEDAESIRRYLEKEIAEAKESYKGHEEEVRCCSTCGIIMRYNSMAYLEGWHFDTCV